MRLHEWLDYLESRHREPIQLGLDRVMAVAYQLNITEFEAIVITVAGTNGKGSTVSALEAIYGTAGFAVASYTSPHLLQFNERIRLNQQPVSDQAICDALATIHKVSGSSTLTYFEMTTLAAFWIFQQQKLDVIILEVGMGGRLDATNIIDADLSIITTIDLDHQFWLGDTRDAIGLQKAGILRSFRPAIYADDNPPQAILDYAEAQQIPLLCYHRDYFVKADETHLALSIREKHHSFLRPQLNIKAVAAAWIAIQQLQHRLPVADDACSAAMQSMSILGRQQCKDGIITQVFDVAHNPQAVRLLANFLESKGRLGKVHAVFSALKDKDLPGLISPMQSLVDVWYPALLPGPRAATQDILQLAFLNAHITWRSCYNDPVLAYEAAMSHAKENDWVVVYGSFLTVSAVLSHCNQSDCGGNDETHENSNR